MTLDPTTTFDRERALDEAITAYIKEAQRGQTPDPAEWQARYPELATDLAEFFADRAALEQVAVPLRSVVQAAAAGTVIGDYELLEEIARGGMGVVYRARQRSLGRVVALKMVLADRGGLDLERFHREAEAAANLDHPNIVPIYEIGMHDGRPFFSMKQIDGVDLRQWFTSELRPSGSGLTLRSLTVAARMLMSTARAVHHAHQRGILHRDLKPSNILIDQAGQPHVADFGLAKRVVGDAASVATQTGAIVGTPSYMAPEQAAAAPTLTTAVDIYGLGAILYEALTSRPPFRAESPLDTLLQVRTQEPPRPRSLNDKADRDLETICLKCFAKDPARRYGSAEALAEDLERWLGGEPIRARRAGAWERTVKWARRRPALAALAVVSAVFVVCVFGFLSWGLQNALRAEQAAEGRIAAEAMLRAADAAARVAAENEAKALKIAHDEQTARAAEALRRTRLVEARLALERGMNRFQNDESAEGLLWLARGLEFVPDDETELQFSLRRLLAGWSRHVHPLQSRVSIAVDEVFDISPDGKLLVGRRKNNPAVVLWDTHTGQTLGKQPLLPSGSARFSRDGKLLLLLDNDANLRLWDVARQKLAGAIPVSAPAGCVDFSADSKHLLTLERPDTDESFIRFWNVPAGTPAGKPLRRMYIKRAQFSPDGTTLLTISGNSNQPPSEMQLYDAVDGKPRGKPIVPPYLIDMAEFSPNGKRFVVCGFVQNKAPAEPLVLLQVFDTATGKPISGRLELLEPPVRVALGPDNQSILVRTDDGFGLYRLNVSDSHRPFERIGQPIAGFHSGNEFSHVWSPDGRSVLLLGEMDEGWLYDPAAGMKIGGSLGRVDRAVFADGGKSLVTVARHEVRCWRVKLPPAGRALEAMPIASVQGAAAFSPDGKTLAVVTEIKASRQVGFWDAATGKPAAQPMPLQMGGSGMQYLAYSPDGKTLLTLDGEGDRPVRLWNAVTHQPIGDPLPAHVGGANAEGAEAKTTKLVISPDSRRLLLVRDDPVGVRAQVWDIRTGKPVGKPLEQRGVLNRLGAAAFSPDGKLIATAGSDNTARLWDAASGEATGLMLTHPRPVIFVAFSPDGNALLTSTDNGDNIARLWDVKTGKLIGVPFHHAGQGSTSDPPLSFSPDGTRVLSIGGERILPRLWDAKTGLPIGPYLRGGGGVPTAFSPDGKVIVSGPYLYDTATGEPISAALPGSASVFSPDSRTIFLRQTGDRRTVARAELFDVPPPLVGDPARLRLWAEVITGRELDAGGEVSELDVTAWQERRDRLQKLGGPPAP